MNKRRYLSNTHPGSVDPDEITLADSAYQNQATPKGAELFTCLKNTRCKSLKADDKMFNKIISKIRVR